MICRRAEQEERRVRTGGEKRPHEYGCEGEAARGRGIGDSGRVKGKRRRRRSRRAGEQKGEEVVGGKVEGGKVRGRSQAFGQRGSRVCLFFASS